MNPALGTMPGPADVVATAPPLAIGRVVVEGRYSTDFDELRLGTSWAAVLPAAP